MHQSAVSVDGSPIRISAESAADYNLFWVHADPLERGNIIVCGMLQDQPDNVTAGYVFSSDDGGSSWQRTLFDNSTRWVSEESCTFGPDNQAYFVDAASDYRGGIPHHEYGHLRVFSSPDGARTWVRTWTRPEGWVDWTYLAFAQNPVQRLVIFGNSASDRLGHWWARRPVALLFDAATSSARGPFAPAVGALNYEAVWTGGSVTLPDGTGLFAATVARSSVSNRRSIGAWWKARLATEFFDVSPVGRVTSRAAIPVHPGSQSFLASLVRDESYGLYRGRLYSAWTETRGFQSQVWLAVSSDSGFHWSARPVVLRATADGARCTDADLWNAKLAVDASGDVGLTWIEGAGLLRFAVSVDGGRTFDKPSAIPLAKAAHAREILGDTVPFDEYGLAEELAAERNEPFTQYVRVSKLGLSVRLQPNARLADSGIVAGPGDSFRVFWAQPGEGGHSLWMQNVSVALPTRLASTKTIPVVPCTGKMRTPIAALPAAAAAAPPSRLGVDASRFFGLDPLHTSFRPRDHAVTIDVRLDDLRRARSQGIVLVATDMHSDFGHATAQGSAGLIGGLPYWHIEPGAGGKYFLRLTFRVADFRDELRPTDEGDLIASELRVYEPERANP